MIIDDLKCQGNGWVGFVSLIWVGLVRVLFRGDVGVLI